MWDWLNRLKHWYPKKPKDPLEALASIYKQVQEDGYKAILIGVNKKTMKWLNKQHKEYRQGIFGEDYFEGKTVLKKIFDLPIAVAPELKEPFMIIAVWHDEWKMFIGGKGYQRKKQSRHKRKRG